MSGLVLNEQAIDPADIKHKVVKIRRSTSTNLGVRMWYQILSHDGEMFQRWTMNMDPTDEILFLSREGDELDIDYIDDLVEDLTNKTFVSFERKVILKAKFKDKSLMK